ncbi:hypothetical protein [Novosphingobium sp.]|uniref:hypothetical protein n=1 Tax=Novosphingobium sp. TaxID=1874826 RepID=UPI0033428CD3
MTIRPFSVLALVSIVAALAGCSDSTPPGSPAAHDPVMAAALQAPLLVDPDLSQQNGRNLAIVPPGPVIAPQPLASSSPE